jgi:hypothetical protein
MKRLSVFVLVALTATASAQAARAGEHRHHHRLKPAQKSLTVQTSTAPAVKRLPIPADTFRA